MRCRQRAGILGHVADLEKHAIKRDRRFLVRLILMVTAGAIAGSLLFIKMTSSEFGTCAANAFGETAAEEALPSDPGTE